MTSSKAKVSCLMVTAKRVKLAQRAIDCFLNQNYSNKELILIDDGEDDYSEVLSILPKHEYLYIKVDGKKNCTLGELRNLSLEHARGDYFVQWDDDDWYHPNRIDIQATILDQGYDACCLSAALMHLNTQYFMNHPYVGHLVYGIPGSIMHRKSDTIRYPETRKAEDTVYLHKWMKRNYIKLDDEFNYLFIRAYHGNNTWEKNHFQRRIKNSLISYLQYYWYKKVLGNLFLHPKFKLDEKQLDSFKKYIEISKKLNLI